MSPGPQFDGAPTRDAGAAPFTRRHFLRVLERAAEVSRWPSLRASRGSRPSRGAPRPCPSCRLPSGRTSPSRCLPTCRRDPRASRPPSSRGWQPSPATTAPPAVRSSSAVRRGPGPAPRPRTRQHRQHGNGDQVLRIDVSPRACSTSLRQVARTRRHMMARFAGRPGSASARTGPVRRPGVEVVLAPARAAALHAGRARHDAAWNNPPGLGRGTSHDECTRCAALHVSSPTMLAARLHGPRDLRVERIAHPGPPPPGHGPDPREGDGNLRQRPALVPGRAHRRHADHVAAGARATSSPGVVEAVADGAPLTATTRRCVAGHPRGGRSRPSRAAVARCATTDIPTCAGDCTSAACTRTAAASASGCTCPRTRASRCRTNWTSRTAPCSNRSEWPSTPSTSRGSVSTTASSIIGAGPIGQLILQLVRLSTAGPVFISDRFPWRLALAERFGGHADLLRGREPRRGRHRRRPTGAASDVVIEAAWADASVDQSGLNGAARRPCRARRHPRRRRAAR